MRKNLIKAAALLFLLNSCNRDQVALNDSENNKSNTQLSKEESNVLFANVIYKAVKNEELRSLLKAEALKKFDDDYDVLYQSIKSKKLLNGLTVEEYFGELSGDVINFKKITNDNPLITIFIPTLPSFSAEKWDVKNGIPVVGIRNINEIRAGKEMHAFNKNGDLIEIPYNAKPNYPILIIKDNERLININASSNARMNRINTEPHTAYLTNELGEFSFWSNSFDRRVLDKEKSLRTNHDGIYTTMEPELREAFENNSTCQRDNVYYHILPQKGRDSGQYRPGYAECIVGIKFVTPAALTKISDNLTEGSLEFSVSTFMTGPVANALNTQIRGFAANVDDLFTYTTKKDAFDRDVVDQVTGLLQKSLYRIPILEWNIKNYGDTWKFAIREVDAGDETTISSSISSTFGTNFTTNDTKNGISFGTSTSTVFGSTFTYKSTNSSDDLAEGVLHYCAPVIQSTETLYNVPFLGTVVMYTSGEKVETGWCELQIEPMKIY